VTQGEEIVYKLSGDARGTSDHADTGEGRPITAYLTDVRAKMGKPELTPADVEEAVKSVRSGI
jgi:hypothetical protein